MELDVLRVGPRAIVGVEGDIDAATAPELHDKIVDLVAEGVRDLVLNLEDTTFVDAAGVDVIVRGLKLLSAHEGTLSLVCRQEHLMKVFDVSALTDALNIYPSLQQALEQAD
jgi:anti-sigma B factor antagonist